MTNPISIIRSLLIYGLCLPLAIYLGYLLANPMDRVSFGVVIVVLFLPLIPLLLRWHHFLLVMSWNMSVVLFFIPGSPYLWLLMTALSLGLTALQYVLKRNVQFASVPSVTLPLLVLAGVIVITAELTGGVGIRAFGDEAIGGKRYIMLLGAIAGYFALTSHRIPPGRGVLYVALYFLGSLTLIVSNAGPWLPSSLYFIFALFPVDRLGALTGDATQGDFVRLTGVTLAAMGALFFVLARHGMRGVFDLGERWRFLPLRFRGGLAINQPWRLLFFFGVVVISLLGGYRSSVIMIALVLLGLFHLEGLARTKLMPVFVLLGIIVVAIGLPLVDKLPITIQRGLSFLPIEVNPIARADAENSSEWRLKIWREVVPTIPQYLLVGKGYSIDARELEEATAFAEYNKNDTGITATVASDFHNGGLSLIIPLGLFGLISFLWFLAAAFRVLRYNYRYGDAEYRRINTFLLAYFTVRVLFFFVIFGSFHTELTIFTGLIGLSISLNGGMCRPAPAHALAPNPAYLPFRLPKVVKA
ncbi:MAG: O-antigen ligase family protein [Verrucomicrobiota bacterium]